MRRKFTSRYHQNYIHTSVMKSSRVHVLEIECKIHFHSNFACSFLILRELKFWNKKLWSLYFINIFLLPTGGYQIDKIHFSVVQFTLNAAHYQTDQHLPELSPHLLHKPALKCQDKKVVDEQVINQQAKAKPTSIKEKLLNVVMKIINQIWFILSVCISSYESTGKFWRVAPGAAESNSSFLSALQSSKVHP